MIKTYTIPARNFDMGFRFIELCDDHVKRHNHAELADLTEDQKKYDRSICADCREEIPIMDPHYGY